MAARIRPDYDEDFFGSMSDDDEAAGKGDLWGADRDRQAATASATKAAYREAAGNAKERGTQDGFNQGFSSGMRMGFARGFIHQAAV